MINFFLVVPVLVSFLITLFLLPHWIRKAKDIGLVWDDMNKISKEKISGSGGIIVVLGFVIGVLFYVAYLVFILGLKNSFLIEIFAMLTVILLLSGLAFVDDLLGWRRGGMSRRARLVLVAFATIPLVVINAGKSVVALPFIGTVDLGLLYPLVVIPIGIIGATTTYNFLAGFNGLEAGQGVLVLSGLAIVAILTNNIWLSLIALIMIASLLAFLAFNFSPASILPGDALTYSVGSLIAMIAILGNFERIAVFFFIPFILETFLKVRGKLKKESFGKLKKDGSLDLAYDKIYSLNHLSIYLMKKLRIKPTETKVVLSIWIFQIVIILLGFLIFKRGF